MANITITLLTSKRTRQTIDALDTVIATQPGGYSVVEGESNATTIEVIYPADYAAQTCYVYMKNAKGEYAVTTFTGKSQNKTFTLPETMTLKGNTILVFYAENSTTKTVWLPVIVPITETSVNYYSPAVATEDMLRETLEAAAAAAAYCAEVEQKAEDGDFNGDSVFIRYSANANGSGMTENWQRGQRYIGTYIGHTASANYADYRWALFVGEAYCDEDSAGGSVSLTLAANNDRTLTSTEITSLAVTIPNIAGTHGFYAGFNFKSGSTAPVFTFSNSSGKPLKIIVNGEVKASYLPTAGKTTQAVIYGDGINVYAYINEV